METTPSPPSSWRSSSGASSPARLERADLTAPIVFVAVGALLAATRAGRRVTAAPETLKPLVEVTLVWVLFSDAARVPRPGAPRRPRTLRAAARHRPAADGLAGWALAPGSSRPRRLAGAAGRRGAGADRRGARASRSSPTRRCPSRIRRLITVESGLNDGIATPVVMVAIAGAAAAEGLEGAPGAGGAGRAGDRGRGRRRPSGRPAAGCCGGPGAGAGPPRTSPASPCWRWPSLAYAGALALHGNGFVAAFCGGLAFGAAAGRRGAGRAGLPRAGGRPGLAAGLAGVRRGRRPDHGRAHRTWPIVLVRRAQPHRGADGPGRARPGRHRAGPRHRAVRRLVRAPRAGLAGLRPARPGGARGRRRTRRSRSSG